MPESTRILFDHDGTELHGDLYVPGDTLVGGVVVVPSVHGPNDYLAAVARRLKSSGYAALVYDLYSRGDHPGDLSDPSLIQRAVASLPDDRVTGDVVAAGEALANELETEVAVLGFCVGGLYAFLAGCSDRFVAAVDFYGMIRYAPGIAESKAGDPIECVPELKAPLLAHFGTLDPWCSNSDVDEFRVHLAGQKKVHEVYSYPGAGHAFDEFHRREVYRPVAAADAWRRSIDFLNYYMQEPTA